MQQWCIRGLFFSLISIVSLPAWTLGGRESPQIPEVRYFLPGEFFGEGRVQSPQIAFESAPGGAYLAGRYAYRNPGLEIDPLPFYQESIAREGSLFAEASAQGLLDLLESSAETTSPQTADILRVLGQTPGPDSARRLANYYYDTEQDRPLLQLIDHMNTQGSGVEPDAEVLLWKIVATQRTSGLLPHDDIQKLNTNFRASGIHWRLSRYIQVRPELEATVDPEIYSLLSTKAAVSQGQYRGNIDQLFTRYLSGAGENLLWDLYNAAVQAGGGQAAVALFRTEAEGSSDPGRGLTLWELIGRGTANKGAHAQAQRDFEVALELLANLPPSPEGELQGQRILWNWFRSGLRQGSAVVLDQLAKFAQWIRNPSYFDDLFQDFLSQLIREQRWQGILQVYRELGPKLSGSTAARVAWIGAEILRLELVAQENLPTRQTLLGVAANQTDDPYYRIVAQVALNQEITLPSTAGPSLTLPFLEHPPQAYEDFAWRLYKAGLREDGYAFIFSRTGTLSLAAIEEFGVAHLEAGEYIDGLRLIERWIRATRPATISPELTRLRYPLAYSQEMTQVIGQRDLNRSIFYGLVREESYFDADIRSSVGATGLSQLMPATAREMSTLLRLTDPNLNDPLTNLTIGGYYLWRLLNRFEKSLYALIAYNGGQGRLSTWLREPWSRSTILLHEGLPFEETRHYVRKILVSAVHYENLADPGDPRKPRDLVRSIFPEL